MRAPAITASRRYRAACDRHDAARAAWRAAHERRDAAAIAAAAAELLAAGSEYCAALTAMHPPTAPATATATAKG